MCSEGEKGKLPGKAGDFQRAPLPGLCSLRGALGGLALLVRSMEVSRSATSNTLELICASLEDFWPVSPMKSATRSVSLTSYLQNNHSQTLQSLMLGMAGSPSPSPVHVVHTCGFLAVCMRESGRWGGVSSGTST